MIKVIVPNKMHISFKKNLLPSILSNHAKNMIIFQKLENYINMNRSLFLFLSHSSSFQPIIPGHVNNFSFWHVQIRFFNIQAKYSQVLESRPFFGELILSWRKASLNFQTSQCFQARKFQSFFKSNFNPKVPFLEKVTQLKKIHTFIRIQHNLFFLFLDLRLFSLNYHFCSSSQP